MSQGGPRRAKLVGKRPPSLLQIRSKESLLETKEVEEKETRAKQLEKRGNILQELFKTETSYVEYLQVAITIFLRPIETSASTAGIRKEQAQDIFQNIEDLQRINGDLLKQMAIRKATTKGSFKGDEVWLDLLRDAFKKVRVSTP